MRFPLGEKPRHVRALPNLRSRIARDPDIGNADGACRIRAVGKQQRLFQLPHCKRFVRAHARFERNAPFRKTARNIARDHVRAAADKTNEVRLVALDRPRQTRSEQTIDD